LIAIFKIAAWFAWQALSWLAIIGILLGAFAIIMGAVTHRR